MDLEIKNTKPSVFDYSDYRQFLNDLYCYYKRETTYFSYRYFSNRAGFKSPNFLKLIIDGQRNLTPKSIPKVAKALRLTKAEENFFTSLTLFNQSQTIKDKSLYSRQIARFRVSQKTFSLKQAQLKYYSHWYYIPLREMIVSGHFKEDVRWISEQFYGEVTEPQIKEAIEDLLCLEIIERDSTGQLIATHKNVQTPDDLISSVVMNYHFDMIDRAAEAIVDYHPQDREISTTCISCSNENVVKIKELVRNFRKDILALTDDDENAVNIYQLNFQLFPIAGVKKRGSR